MFCSVFVLYELKMENPKIYIYICLANWEFLSGIGKNILFGIGNGAKFRPQNWMIERPELQRVNLHYLVVA